MHARAMVRTRVRTEGGNVGVLFVVNPGRRTTGKDLDLFERVARQVTSTYEHAMLERQRVSRTACRFMGVAALSFGIACLVAAVVAQLAWALPLRELLTRASVLPGVSLSMAGAFLLFLARRP